MKKINFTSTKPYFEHKDFKWYIDEDLQDYIQSKQAANLPKLKNLACFIVVNKDSQKYVLIDNKQNIISEYQYNSEGYGQTQAKINILKIHKHFQEHEKKPKTKNNI